LDALAEHDAEYFSPGADGYLTRDEESSGIIEITDILHRADSNRYYLADVQAHYALGGELVEGGQLVVLTAVPEASTWITAGVVASAAGMTALRRRSKNSRA
jgi:hypothetical protein